MERHSILGDWAPFKSQAKQHWGKVPENHVSEIEGCRDQLARRFQQRYGTGREEALRQIDQWLTPKKDAVAVAASDLCVANSQAAAADSLSPPVP